MSETTIVPVHEPLCKLCNHIAVDKINQLLVAEEKSLSAEELRKWLARNYPTEPIPSIPAVLNHKKKHLLGVAPNESIGQLKIDRRSGRLVDATGRRVEAVGILAAVKVIISVGIGNIMKNPESITPSHTLKALELLKQLNIPEDDPDADTWAEAVVNPDAIPQHGNGRPRTPKTGRQLLDEVTEIIETEVSSEDDDDELIDPVDYDYDQE